jgi:RND family efflux transporter MFP subunit
MAHGTALSLEADPHHSPVPGSSDTDRSRPISPEASLCQSWLVLQCRMIPDVSGAVAVFEPFIEEGRGATVGWPEGRPAPQDLTAIAQQAAASRSPVMVSRGPGDGGSEGSGLAVACPLICAGRVIGGVAVQARAMPEAQRNAVVQLLEWGGAWLELLLTQERPADPAGLPAVLDTVVGCLQHDRLEAASTAVATELAQRLGCERVSVGLLRRRRLRLLALSHNAHFEPRANLVRHIEAAMEEALDLGTMVTYPPPVSELEGAAAAHGRLAEDAGAENLCTVPLMGRDRPMGALTLERSAERPFDAGTLAHCEGVALAIGPILDMMRREERPLPLRLGDHLAVLARRVLGPRELRLKLVLVALIAAAAFLDLAAGEYRVTAPAMLEGKVQRAVVAPFDGYIAVAHARAGETVQVGDVLAELDDKDLRLERRRRRSEREELLKQFRKALAGLDHSEARILRTQVEQAQAQLALLDEQLARTRLTAPFDGVIISGDLSRSLGTPVQRGQVLFEVAPLDDYRVVIEVDERDIRDVTEGQHGYLTLSATPGERLNLTVRNVSAISRTEEGNAAFRVEAQLEAPPAALRPGMQGIGKIVIGKRKLAWIWTRRLVGRLQLWLWSWWP